MVKLVCQKGAAEALFAETPYRPLHGLGEIGAREVFLVEHRETGRKCVARLVSARHAALPRIVDGARLEAQILGRLRHPHVVAALGAGVAVDGRPFIVVEHLAGGTLKEALVERGPLAQREALVFACEILSALAAAHELGVAHRALRPEGVFLAARPDGTRGVKLLDFEAARLLPDAPSSAPRPLSAPSDEGAGEEAVPVVGPDAALGLPGDERTDVYATALVLYEMLTGRCRLELLARLGFPGDAASAELAKPPTRRALGNVSPGVAAVLLRALSVRPEGRFSSAEHFKLALERLLETREPSSSCTQERRRAASGGGAPRRAEGRALLLLFLVVLVCAAGLAAGLTAFMNRSWR